MLGTSVDTKGGIASVVRNYYECGLMKRLNIDYMPTHKDGSKLGKLFFYVLQIPKIFIRMPKYDVVHVHTSQGWSFRRLIVIFFLARLLGLPVIWHVHGSQFDAYFEGSNLFEKFLIRYGFTNSAAVIALSGAWKDAINKMAPSANVVILHNAVYIPKYQIERSYRHNPVNVLFLGRLGRRKGIYDLIEVIHAFKGREIRFVLAGDGDVDHVKSLVNDNDMSEIVHIPGWVGSDEVVDLLREADIYVLPSYDEGLPMGLLEAMAAGLPVISTTIGGIPEAISDSVNGYLIEPGNKEQLTKYIQLLLDDDELWFRMSSLSAKRAIDDFSMDMVEQRLSTLYSETF